MRRLLLATFAFTACEAAAIVNPRLTPEGREKIRAIEEQVRIANRLDDGVRKAQQLLAAAETDKKPEATLHQLELAIEREKDKQRAAYTKAIHMTLDAYDLHPRVRRGTSVMPQTRGRVIEWLPIAHERAAREVRGADDSTTHMSQPKIDLAGNTYPDGVVYIDPETFTRGVGYLASTLLHERTHFEQYITPGKGDVMTVAKAQEEAYGAERDDSEYFFDEKIPKEKAEIDQTDRFWRDANAAVQARERRSRTLVGRLQNWYQQDLLADSFADKPRTNEELAAIKKSTERLRAEIDADNAARARLTELLRTPLAEAGPAPAHASPSAAPPTAGYMTPFPALAEAAPPSRLPVPLPVASEEVYHLARQACLGDWNAASYGLDDFYRLTEADLRGLEGRASGGDCLSMLLRRLVAIRRGGETLDLARLRLETQAIQNPPVYDEPLERDRRPSGCIKRGVWFPQC